MSWVKGKVRREKRGGGGRKKKPAHNKQQVKDQRQPHKKRGYCRVNSMAGINWRWWRWYIVGSIKGRRKIEREKKKGELGFEQEDK